MSSTPRFETVLDRSALADVEGNAPTYPLTPHWNFQASYDELHNRPFPVLSEPVRISHIALLNDDSDRARVHSHLSELCQRYEVEAPGYGDTCFYQNFGDFEIRWEQHFEFCSYTFLVHEIAAQPFKAPPITLIPQDWLADMPGQLITALHVEIRQPDEHTGCRQTIRNWFDGQRLISSEISNGQARLWSAFQLHEDSFSRVLLENHDLAGCPTGRVLRTLLELETYRNMTLLAFPLARRIGRQVTHMERQLAEIVHEMNTMDDSSDERPHLGRLSEMATSVAELVAETRYRFDAAKAYHELVGSRLEELNEQEVADFQTMAAFIDRRLSPAFRTVVATQNRMDDLSRRIDSASEFLRTRVNMSIEAQNQELLQSMNHRAKLQLHLQQTVEGLSVLVITYYIVALIEKMLTGVEPLASGIDRGLVIAGLIPLAMALVWGFSRRWKKRLDGLEKEKEKEKEK